MAILSLCRRRDSLKEMVIKIYHSVRTKITKHCKLTALEYGPSIMSMMNLLSNRLLLLPYVFVAVLSSNSIACQLTNESSWFWKDDRLIKEASNIFLVKIKDYSKTNGFQTNYKGEMIEILKTNDTSRFRKGGELVLENFAPPETDTKTWEKGWSNKSGRAIHTKECKIWVPFTVGKSYLIFYEILNSKAYEEINDPSRDSWYKLVKKQIKN